MNCAGFLSNLWCILALFLSVPGIDSRATVTLTGIKHLLKVNEYTDTEYTDNDYTELLTVNHIYEVLINLANVHFRMLCMFNTNPGQPIYFCVLS